MARVKETDSAYAHRLLGQSEAMDCRTNSEMELGERKDANPWGRGRVWHGMGGAVAVSS